MPKADKLHWMSSWYLMKSLRTTRQMLRSQYILCQGFSYLLFQRVRTLFNMNLAIVIMLREQLAQTQQQHKST